MNKLSIKAFHHRQGLLQVSDLSCHFNNNKRKIKPTKHVFLYYDYYEVVWKLWSPGGDLVRPTMNLTKVF